jgi:hypothetical protein
MKIGVKTYNNKEFLKHFEHEVDFFEVMVVQGNDYSFLKDFSLPFTIHAEHKTFGSNPADISKKEFNLKSINFARKIADETNAKKIILHPGYLDNANCSEQNAIDFFREVNDERILVENISSRKYLEMLCISPSGIEKFIQETHAGFCFDINHCREFITFDGNYDFIKKYLQFNPVHYHLGGQKISIRKDHLCLQDSELDMEKILSYYPSSSEITLETEPEIYKTEKDLEIIRKVLKELGK